MGDVWLAKDDLLDRYVVVKFVRQDLINQQAGLDRLLYDEATAASRLIGHKSVVALLDFLQVDAELHTGPVIVMEYVDGMDLSLWIRTQEPSLDQETRTVIRHLVAHQLASAIAHAHDQGVMHRDIKPNNVLLSKGGSVKLADFGLARFVEQATRTHTVAGMGTLYYMAPEQFLDKGLGAPTDIYQMSATLYHLFVGTVACPADGYPVVLQWHMGGSVADPISSRAEGIHEELASVVDGGLRQKASERPTMDDFLRATSAALAEPVRIGSDDLPYPAPIAAEIALGEVLRSGVEEFSRRIYAVAADPEAVKSPHPWDLTLSFGSLPGGRRELYLFSTQSSAVSMFDESNSVWMPAERMWVPSIGSSIVSTSCASFNTRDSLGSARIDSFILDTNGDILHRVVSENHQEGSWSAFPLRAPFATSLCGASPSPWHCELIALNGDGSLYHAWTTDHERWTAWSPMQSPPTTEKVVAINATGVLGDPGDLGTGIVLVAATYFGELWACSLDKGWSDWTKVGIDQPGDLLACCAHRGGTEVFGTTGDRRSLFGIRLGPSFEPLGPWEELVQVPDPITSIAAAATASTDQSNVHAEVAFAAGGRVWLTRTHERPIRLEQV
jgi:serine/threonine protein kinase